MDSSAPSCAPPPITSIGDAGWRDIGKLDEALVEYQLASELNPSSREIDAALNGHTKSTPDQSRRGARRKNAARDAHRAGARPAAARPRSADRREDARFADIPRREQPSDLPHDCALVGHQPRLRLHVPRNADHDRSAERVARHRARRCCRRDADVFPCHRQKHRPRHPRYAGQASGVRGRSRAHVLSEQRRPERNAGPDAARARRAPHLADHRQQCASPSRTRRSACHGCGSPDHRDRQGPARGRHRRRAARSRSHEADGIRAADRVARIARHRRIGLDCSVRPMRRRLYHASRCRRSPT